MFYDRKIKYLDYMEEGERVKNVGFIKIEVRDEECNIHIQIKDAPIRESITREILLNGCGKTSSLGEITILNGEGDYTLYRSNSASLGDKAIAYTELENIQIVVDHSRVIQCVWEQKKTTKQDAIIVETKSVLEQQGDKTLQAAEQEEIVAQEKQNREQCHSKKEWELKFPGLPSAHSSKDENMTFREDKWSQIASIYPHICPFEDEREYIMMQPRDFVMLGSRSYSLVNNSFLLHGYYNYNHLVLAKKLNRGEDIYYIGVPGNFYDREKQVAVMFGFESFECKEEPAGQGDYGYYMIKVDL